MPKLRDPAAFRSSVAAYKILPEGLVTPVARSLPPLEVAIAIMLLAGVLVVPVSVLAALALAPGPGVAASAISTQDAWAAALVVVAGYGLVALLLELRRFAPRPAPGVA